MIGSLHESGSQVEEVFLSCKILPPHVVLCPGSLHDLDALHQLKLPQVLGTMLTQAHGFLLHWAFYLDNSLNTYASHFQVCC